MTSECREVPPKHGRLGFPDVSVAKSVRVASPLDFFCIDNGLATRLVEASSSLILIRILRYEYSQSYS